MNIPQIITDDMKQLLNKYYEGLTTEQEEQTLKDWLLSEDVPEEFAADRELFLQLQSAADEEVEMPDGFSERLEALIDSEAQREELQKSSRQSAIRKMFIAVGSVAAACLVFFMIFNHVSENSQAANYIVEVKDPVLAREYTVMALNKFSDAFNKGYDGLEKAEKCLQVFSKQ